VWLGCVLALAGVAPRAAHGWSNHTLGLYPAVETMPEVKNAPEVKPETLDAFLAAEAPALEGLLAEQEARMRQQLPDYSPRPDGLAFKAAGPAETLRARFLEAIRVNPNSKTPLYVQPHPGNATDSRAPIAWKETSIFEHSSTSEQTTYLSIAQEEGVSALEVVATACDEPDYGLDIGLFEDNNTEYGKRYGFGKQPFGNPRLVYGSQAPFHMGFYHEAGIIYKLAGFLKKTYPEYRIDLYQTLARHAFKTGHAYWGWRFTGWGLHYIQDLTQPYHARVFPGMSTGKMLRRNILSVLGIKKPQENSVQLVTNRHLALENYQYFLLKELLTARKQDAPVLKALAPGNTESTRYSLPGIRSELTQSSADASRSADNVLDRSLPRRLVDDPTYLFEETEPDINVVPIVREGSPEKAERLDALLESLLGEFGRYSRAYIRANLSSGS
jgi:hypothetical protein